MAKESGKSEKKDNAKGEREGGGGDKLKGGEKKRTVKREI